MKYKEMKTKDRIVTTVLRNTVPKVEQIIKTVESKKTVQFDAEGDAIKISLLFCFYYKLDRNI